MVIFLTLCNNYNYFPTLDTRPETLGWGPVGYIDPIIQLVLNSSTAERIKGKSILAEFELRT